METKKNEVKQVQNVPMTTKSLFARNDIQSKFNELLGKKAQGFITSILQIVNSNDLLKKADPLTIYNAAAMAATMDLPINQNLGYAYIVPYKGQAQFQMGWKGFVQLAQRTGQFKTINAVEVYENQIESIDYLTGETKLKNIEPKGLIIGYIAYFRLLNGFEKSLYMGKEQMKQHATKYSQSYKKGYGVWADGEDGFNAMAKKTVLKLLLSKYAPLSIEMQKANIIDQSVLNDDSGNDVTYQDNTEDAVVIDKELERIELMVSDCKTVAELELLQSSYPDIDSAIFENKKQLLTTKK